MRASFFYRSFLDSCYRIYVSKKRILETCTRFGRLFRATAAIWIQGLLASASKFEQVNLPKMKRQVVVVGILILFFLPLVSNQVKTVHGNASMSLHQSGYQLVDSNGNVVYLHGCCDFDPDYSTSVMGGGDTNYMLTRFQWIQSQGGNFYRIFINAEWLVGNTGNYRGHLEDLLSAAESCNIYVDVMFSELKQGAGGFGDELPYDPYIKDPGWTTSSFNNACVVLANLLKNHPNALLEIWNEPMNMDQSAYYQTYWSNIPTTIQQIRNAGFTGIIVVMGEVSFAPGYDDSGMVWAINHPNIAPA